MRPVIRKSLLTLFLPALLLAGALKAQYYNQRPDFLRANGVWSFGVTAGLNFNTRAPFAFRSSVTSMEGCVSVASPTTGKLLFASGASFCYGSNQSGMPNGTGLLGDGDGSTAQGKCVVPVLDTPGKYYLFSLEGFGSPPTIIRSGKLYYSIVDTSLNFGLGDIVAARKNILVDSGFAESMIAIPGNSCDVWLLLHMRDSAVFKAYHITGSGIDLNPVISRTGQLQGQNAYVVGCMAVSPARDMVAITSTTAPGSNPSVTGALVCRFDPSTGQVSNSIQLHSYASYSVCFSPDNSKIYTSALLSSAPGSGQLLQYEVSNYNAAAITASAVNVAPPGRNTYGLRLYNDTVYINTFAGYSLDRISNPNLTGPACNYDTSAIPMYWGTLTQTNLPNDVILPLPGDTIFAATDTAICGDMPAMTLRAPSGFDQYEWNDQSSDSILLINEPGIYWVYSRQRCNIRTDSFIVKRSEAISVNLGPDTVICSDAGAVSLSPTIPGAAYLWQDGSTGNSFQVSGSGIYWVTASRELCTASDTIDIRFRNLEPFLGNDTILCTEDPAPLVLQAYPPEGASVLWSDGSNAPTLQVQAAGRYWVTISDAPCMGTDTIFIGRELCNCILRVPDAFTPNGDGKNDRFRPIIQNGCDLKQYDLAIFNRWGQLCFSSTDPSAAWEGDFNGSTAEGGTYMYILKWAGGTRGKEQVLKGDITLLR